MYILSYVQMHLYTHVQTDVQPTCPQLSFSNKLQEPMLTLLMIYVMTQSEYVREDQYLFADSHHSITTHWLSQSCWVHMFTNENKVVDLRVAPYSCFSFFLPILSIDVRVYISHRYNGTDQHP